MKQFYLHDGRHKHGPYHPEELQQFHITKQTSVFAVDANQWLSAGEIRELNILFQDKKISADSSWKKVRNLLSKIKGK
ncbi:MAG: GYF domain-containing protein [Bacteroidota bacterium]